jgi:hypothetical protein
LTLAKQFLARAAHPPAALAPTAPAMPMGVPFPFGMPSPPMPGPDFDPNCVPDPTFGLFPGAQLPPGTRVPGMFPTFDPNAFGGMGFGDGSGW